MNRPYAAGLATLLALGCGAFGPRAPAAGRLAPIGPPVVSQARLDGQALLSEPSSRAASAGAGPVALVAAGEAVERERIGAFVEVPADVCLLAYARGSSSLEDLDLAAFNDEGTPVGVDDAPDPHPTILVCPPHPSRVYVAAVAASGEGLVVIGAHLVPVGRAAEVGSVMNARGTRLSSTRAADAWPGLDDQIRRHHETIGGKWEVFRKVALIVDARLPATLGFPLEADGCTDALVVPDDDVAIVDVEVLDDRGTMIARAGLGSRNRVVTVCSPLSLTGTLSVRPHLGQGLVAIVLSRGPGDLAKGLALTPDVMWTASTLPLDTARQRREASLRPAGYAPAAASYKGELSLGTARSVKVELPSRVCSRLDVVGGAPAALLSATAWSDAGDLVATAQGAADLTLFACGGAPLRVELEARGRPGPFQILVRPEPWTDSVFMAHPIPAARMMTRMASGVGQLFHGSAAAARAFVSDAGHETAWNEVIPAGTCVQVVAGAAGSGAGLVARLTDAGTGDELDRAHAAETVSLRGCAPEAASRAVHVSVRVTGGRLDVVVGERFSG